MIKLEEPHKISSVGAISGFSSAYKQFALHCLYSRVAPTVLSV